MRRSVIQLTMVKITVLVFCIFLMLYFFIARIYWQKEVLSRQVELLAIANAVELKIQANYQYIQNYKDNEKLIPDERIDLANDILQNFMNIKAKEDPKVWVGYYDLDLESAVASASVKESELAGHLIHSDIAERLAKSQRPVYIADMQAGRWDGQGLIGVAVPIFNQDEMVGYTWALKEDSGIFYKAYLDYAKFFAPSILLWIFVLLLIKRNITDIKNSLDAFTKLVLRYRTGYKEDPTDMEQLEALPELKPVAEKVRGHLEHLESLNKELEQSNAKLLALMEGIGDGFIALDNNWRCTFINDKAQRVTKEEELELCVGRDLGELKAKLMFSETEDNLHNVMLEKKPRHWEVITSKKRTLQLHAYPFAEGISIFLTDITEVKKQESELQRLERLNLIGQMAAGISHEVRNPLTIVRGFLQMLEAKAESDKNREYMEIMISEIDRANEIITDFLSLAKANVESHVHENINAIITRIFPMLQADALNTDRNVEIELGDIPKLKINESEIKQLVLNLVRNGIEETPEGKSVFISTYLDGGQVVLAIKDEGQGIPPEVQEKMGTPFITTKETGTGLGLAISMGIASRHKAVFEYDTGSEGTTFYIKFPCDNE